MNGAVVARAIAGAAWGGRPLAWESCAALLARLQPGRDVVASLPDGGFLACQLRAHVAPARLFLHQSADQPADAPRTEARRDICMSLGAEDREPWPAAALPWPSPTAPQAPRRRRLDTLYADSHAPGLLVLGGADQAAILRGALRLLKAHRPMLLLDFCTVAPAARAALWEECAAACAAQDYGWHDSLLMPCAHAADRLTAMAVLGHCTGVGLPAETAQCTTLPDGIAALLAPHDVAVAALAWRPPPGIVPHHPAAVAGYSVSLDAALPARGLHQPESADGGVWRWTGPGPCATLMLPIPGPGPWRLRLEVVNWGAAHAPGTLRAVVGGAFLPIERQGDTFISFAPLAPPAFWAGAPLRVDLTTPRPQRASAQDPRCLGVCLSAATVTPL